MQGPPEREWRDERMRGGDPRRGYDRHPRQRYRSPMRLAFFVFFFKRILLIVLKVIFAYKMKLSFLSLAYI